MQQIRTEETAWSGPYVVWSTQINGQWQTNSVSVRLLTCSASTLISTIIWMNDEPHVVLRWRRRTLVLFYINNTGRKHPVYRRNLSPAGLPVSVTAS